MKRTVLELAELASEILIEKGELSLPIDIDSVIEKHGIDLIPLQGLRRETGLSGALSGDLKNIYYDEWEGDRNLRRTRFTLAHEFAHVVLHGDKVQKMDRGTLGSWRQEIRKLYKEDSYDMEREADYLAGFLLVPSALLIQEMDSGTPRHELYEKFDVSTMCMEIRYSTYRWKKI